MLRIVAASSVKKIDDCAAVELLILPCVPVSGGMNWHMIEYGLIRFIRSATPRASRKYGSWSIAYGTMQCALRPWNTCGYDSENAAADWYNGQSYIATDAGLPSVLSKPKIDWISFACVMHRMSVVNTSYSGVLSR